MEVILRGEPNEIAALVVGLQERQGLEVTDDTAIRDIAKAICDIRPEALKMSDS